MFTLCMRSGRARDGRHRACSGGVSGMTARGGARAAITVARPGRLERMRLYHGFIDIAWRRAVAF